MFETVLAGGGRVQALDAHLERLAGSVAELYGLALPDGLRSQICTLAASDPGPRRLRIDAIPADGLRIELTSSPLPDGAGAGVRCRPVVVPGGLGRHKWRDRRLIRGLDADGHVPLLIDSGGELLEAAWANVWLIEDGRLLTPPADGRILPGVTRAKLFELRSQAREEPVTLDRAKSAQALFLTSALRHAVVATLGEHPVQAGEVTEIRAALSAWS